MGKLSRHLRPVAPTASTVIRQPNYPADTSRERQSVNALRSPSSDVTTTLEAVAQEHFSALPTLPLLAERDWERVTALYAPDMVPTLPGIIRTAQAPDGRVLATWARLKGEADKWPRPTICVASANALMLESNCLDDKAWEFLLSGEAEALAMLASGAENGV